MRILLLISLFLLAFSSQAHEATVSQIRLIEGEGILYLDLTMPEDQLALAWQPLSVTSNGLSQKERSSLMLYIADHLWLESGDSRFGGQLVQLNRGWEQQGEQLVPVVEARLEFHQAEFAAGKMLTLHSDLILHQVASHRTYVTLMSGLAGGAAGVQSLGILRLKHTEVSLSLEQASVLAGMGSFFMSGVGHILEGADHLLFILCLILAIPALGKYAGGSSQTGTRISSPRISSALTEAVMTVSAFTLTHALSMALVSFGWINPGFQWVEVAIASSLLIAGFLLFVPHGRMEAALLAAVFGLIHGLAFANSLIPLQLNNTDLGLALVSFIGGTEMIQLGLVIALVPVLIALRYTRMLSGVRAIIALGTIFAGSVWLWERSQGGSLESVLDTATLQNILLSSYAIAASLALPRLAFMLRFDREPSHQHQH
ncbi:MAG: HupE/UreJ family protein, partial [Thalassolituus sp.]